MCMSDSSCWSLSAAGASSGFEVVVAPGAAALISAQGPPFGDDVCGLPVGCAGTVDRIRPISTTKRRDGLRALAGQLRRLLSWPAVRFVEAVTFSARLLLWG